MLALANFPFRRSRRTRSLQWIRDLTAESHLSAKDLIWPVFVMEGENQVEEIKSLPGVSRMSIDKVVECSKDMYQRGLTCVALFPYTPSNLKTPNCEEAWNPENLVNRATRALKKEIPQLGVMLDVALDPYNSQGHDGLFKNGKILNDESLEALTKQALIQAESGADILGPSDMMDGRIGKIRSSLEKNNYKDTIILSYSAKYASSFYGPFRDAVGASGSLKGDKKTYQINPSNSDESLREVAADLTEGADMVMVKPGMPYLDMCRRIKDTFGVPTYAYQVSGEYAMIQAAANNGWIDGDTAVFESILCFKRAGCDGVLTYFAPKILEILEGL